MDFTTSCNTTALKFEIPTDACSDIFVPEQKRKLLIVLRDGNSDDSC